MPRNIFRPLANLHPQLGNNFIDANVLDEGSPDQNDAVKRMLSLAERAVFTLLLPHSVKGEIDHPRTPPEVKRRAAKLIYSRPVQLTVPELETHKRIGELIRGNAKSEQHASDAFHLVEAAKYGGRHFITRDKRLLKKAPEIWRALQIWVLSPTEFIADYYPHAHADTVPMESKDLIGPATRKIVTRDELDRFLTDEIRKIKDLEDARLSSQYLLQEPDEEGCNWTGAILNPGSKGSPEYATPHAYAIVQSARQRFNITE